jgi:quinol monooxygenase YgiN
MSNLRLSAPPFGEPGNFNPVFGPVQLLSGQSSSCRPKSKPHNIDRHLKLFILSKEVIMQAKILIKRKFKKGKKSEIIALLKELRARALLQTGYISGETLSAADHPQTLMVIGSWQDMESWHNWKGNNTRKTLEQMLATYQEGSTEYQEFVLGGFIEE